MGFLGVQGHLHWRQGHWHLCDQLHEGRRILANHCARLLDARMDALAEGSGAAIQDVVGMDDVQGPMGKDCEELPCSHSVAPVSTPYH